MINELMRRRTLLSGETLPYDAEVEWLSNGGTAYIDTGIIPIDTPRIVINLMISGFADTDVFGFSSNTIPSFIGDLYVEGKKQSFHYYRYYSTWGIGESLLSTAKYDNWAEWDLGYICKCNGITLETLTRQSFASNTQTLYLFKGRTINSSLVRVGATQIYDGDTLMRDFIPVRVGQVGYMYDKVSKQLFANVGSGAFVFGNDI